MEAKGTFPSGNDGSPKKKAKLVSDHNQKKPFNDVGAVMASLPLAFEQQLVLAIPFVSAGDLGEIAAVNRTCRRVALASYHRRRLSKQGTHTMPTQIPNHASGLLPPTECDKRPSKQSLQPVTVETGASGISKCFKQENPWCGQTTKRKLWVVNDGTATWSLMMTAEAAAVLEARATSGNSLLRLKRETLTLHPPDGLPLDQNTKPVECIVQNNSLLVIAERRSSVNGGTGEDEEDSNSDDGDSSEEENTRLELWGILYEIETADHPSSLPGSMKKLDNAAAVTSDAPRVPEVIYRPQVAQRLSNPTHPELCTGCDGARHGQTTWSGNGKVIAVVTSTPNCCEFDGDGPAVVTIFDVMNDRFVERYRIDVATFNHVGNYSGLCISAQQAFAECGIQNPKIGYLLGSTCIVLAVPAHNFSAARAWTFWCYFR